MPWIDAERGVLVVRIVYDGPAMSGKTTSMRALARGVSRSVECPEERDGRTVYFDWLEYTAGLFEGRQICCQIVSVPGQRELSHRRQLLLDSADAVVCVLDTRRSELEFGLGWVSELLPGCRHQTPPVGVVLQANKRDAEDAVPRDELRERLGPLPTMAVVEAVATSADGIREAFVLAVRLALDRVRALGIEQLPGRAPFAQTPEALLSTMSRAERAPAPVIGRLEPIPELVEAPAPPPASVPTSQDEELMFTPDPALPGGMIWPPVDGRMLLHEVAVLGIRPARTARGDWWGTGAGWRFHSPPWALFADAGQARDRLIQWARMHASNADRISSGRAVILADAGGGRLRLWQLVRVEATLRERLDALFATHDTDALAAGLLEVASQLLTARDRFAETGALLRCSLWTVCAERSSRPRFVGLMPDVNEVAQATPSPQQLLSRELVPQLRELRRTRLDYGELSRKLRELGQYAPANDHAQTLAQVVASVA